MPVTPLGCNDARPGTHKLRDTVTVNIYSIPTTARSAAIQSQADSKRKGPAGVFLTRQELTGPRAPLLTTFEGCRA